MASLTPFSPSPDSPDPADRIGHSPQLSAQYHRANRSGDGALGPEMTAYSATGGALHRRSPLLNDHGIHKSGITGIGSIKEGPTPPEPVLFMGTTALESFGSELAFIQDASGQYWDFFWRDAEQHRLSALDLCGCALVDCAFAPVAIADYLNRLQEVLTHGQPQRFECLIQVHRTDGQPNDPQDNGAGAPSQLFELVMSPILTAEPQARQVMVMGRSIMKETTGQVPSILRKERTVLSESGLEAHQRLLSRIARSIRRTLPLSSALYQILLTKISRQIRRTLDLKNIWRQTVEGLGQAISVSRCVIWSPLAGADQGIMDGQDQVKVTAEYVRDGCTSMLGETTSVAQLSGFLQTIGGGEPVAIAQAPDNPHGNQSVLVVATRYREVVNGFIALYQCDRNRQWTGAEVELLRELSDQVGTAIAHANLFAESQTLTNQLRENNLSLLKKQQELEDARQQAEEVSRLKSEFLANTSHEIRTPLNGIIGSLQLVVDGIIDEPEETQEFLETAHNSAMHLLSILNDILDVAKIEADRLEVSREPVKLSSLLANTENFTQAQIQKKGLYFEVDVPDTHDEILLYGDYQRLMQVILNITGNAIKFTHEGGVTISVELISPSSQDNDDDTEAIAPSGLGEPDVGMALIRIADTGIGVALDKQDKLFQAFSQADGARTRKYGGTGLGLVLSEQLVQAMGGEINFYSLGEGLGSTVTFTVPLYQNPLVVAAEDV